jgi:multiple sugar transport system substrate-binding protein
MKKLVISLVLLIASMSLVFAGGSAEEEAAASGETEVTTIRMASWLGLQDVSKEMFAEIVERFEAENPDINVEMVGVPFEQQQQQMMVAVSGGNAPDIMHFVPMWLTPFVRMGAVTPVSDLMNDEQMSDIPQILRDQLSFDGDLYALPLQNGAINVLASKELLEEAGLPQQIPETWEDFRDAVEAITNLGDDIYGYGARTAKNSNSAFWFFPVMWGHGGEFQADSGEIVFDNPGTLAALNWYKEIGQTGQTPIGMGIPEVRNLFAQNKVGFIIDGPWMKGVMRNASGLGEEVDDDYIVGVMPEAPDGNRYTIANHHILTVSAQSENKEEAMRFIEFLIWDEEITALHNDRMGAIPLMKSLVDDPRYQNDPFARAFIEAAEIANPLPSKHENFAPSLEFVANAFQQSLLGGNAEQAMNSAADSVRTLYGQ